MTASQDIAKAQNFAIYGERYCGQEAFFDFDVLSRLLPADIQTLRILEIGAGNAAIACRLAGERGAHVICVELDAARVRIARQNVFRAGLDDSVTIVHADMDRLESAVLRDYDVVISLDALQHSRDLPSLLERIIGDPTRPSVVVATMWCCAEPDLAARWGFQESYEYSEVADVVAGLRPAAHVWRDPDFANRFERYFSFLEREESRLIASMGHRAFAERCDLILATLGAIDRGRFGQLVMSA